ncbi:MAG: hypothetical protein ACYTG0_46150, partial [Planctomycetota bacterium]
DATTFPASLATVSILSAGPDPLNVAAFSYPLGTGFVYYSTIPLDRFLAGFGNNPPRDEFTTIYAPNALTYVESLGVPEVDFYKVPVPALESGGELLVSTATPGDGTGEPVNDLDPKIRVYDASGTLIVSDDNSGADGRNALVMHHLAPSGAPTDYYVEVLASDDPSTHPTKGPYVLSIDLTPAPPPPGITLNKTSVVTTEAGGYEDVSVVLDTDPGDGVSVTIGISSDDETEGTVFSTSLLFTGGASGNWNVAQTFRVTGQDDDEADGDSPYTIVTAAATASDTSSPYHGLDAADVSAINVDDDTPGISVTPVEGVITHEDPAEPGASVTVVLDSRPEANVRIDISTSDVTEGLVSVAARGFTPAQEVPGSSIYLIFTPSDWNVPQTVDVSGLNDDLDDAHAHYTLTLDPAASAAAEYAALAPVVVSAINRDDDPNPLFVRELDFFEDGDFDEYGLINPAAPVRVTAAAALDGSFGLERAREWTYRTDAQAQVAQGDVISVKVRSDGEPMGRAYFGFGAVSKGRPTNRGTLSIGMAANTGQLVLQRNVQWGHTEIAAVPQTWEAHKTYRMEVEWRTTGEIIGRLYDNEGTLLNCVTATDTTFTAGGIAFKAFGSVKQHFDTAEVQSAPASTECPSAVSLGAGAGTGRGNSEAASGTQAGSAHVVDLALLAWVEPDASDDDDTDLLAQSLVDDLAMMLVE